MKRIRWTFGTWKFLWSLGLVVLGWAWIDWRAALLIALATIEVRGGRT